MRSRFPSPDASASCRVPVSALRVSCSECHACDINSRLCMATLGTTCRSGWRPYGARHHQMRPTLVRFRRRTISGRSNTGVGRIAQAKPQFCPYGRRYAIAHRLDDSLPPPLVPQPNIPGATRSIVRAIHHMVDHMPHLLSAARQCRSHRRCSRHTMPFAPAWAFHPWCGRTNSPRLPKTGLII